MHLFEIFHLRVECKEWDHQASSQSLAQQNELGPFFGLVHWLQVGKSQPLTVLPFPASIHE
jgi:hypothetical protein